MFWAYKNGIYLFTNIIIITNTYSDIQMYKNECDATSL